MKTRWLLCLSALALCGAAQAFELKTRSENPAIGEDVLRAAANQISAEVGSKIPSDPNIKVYVYSAARPSKIEGQTIYFHRIQLTKAFAAGAPYPTSAWLPIKSVERYGIEDAATVRAKLDEALRDFFTQVNALDPNQRMR